MELRQKGSDMEVAKTESQDNVPYHSPKKFNSKAQTKTDPTDNVPYHSPKKFNSKVQILAVFGFGVFLGAVVVMMLYGISSSKSVAHNSAVLHGKNSPVVGSLRKSSSSSLPSLRGAESDAGQNTKLTKTAEEKDETDDDEDNTKPKENSESSSNLKTELPDVSGSHSFWELQNTILNEQGSSAKKSSDSPKEAEDSSIKKPDETSKKSDEVSKKSDIGSKKSNNASKNSDDASAKRSKKPDHV